MRPVLALGLCLALGGCADLGIGPQQVAGALGAGFGGAAGGYVGSHVGSGVARTGATIAGASLGALFGGAIASKLAASDRDTIAAQTQVTLESSPSNLVQDWRNPDTGNAGTVVAGPATVQGTAPCRPFEQSVTVDGETARTAGTACRQPDGTWVKAEG
jgi:surface antigen